MSTRGRGRGRGGVVKPNDRSSSSSSAASSRSSSLTHSSTTSTATVPDIDRLQKQLSQGTVNAGSLVAGATRTTKFAPNLNVAKKEKDKTDAGTPNPSTLNHPGAPSNRRDQFRPNTPRGAHANNRGGFGRGNLMQVTSIFESNAQIPTSSPGSTSGGRGGSSSGKRENSASSIRMPNAKKIIPTKKTLIGDVDGLKYEIDAEYEPRQIPIADRKSVFDVKKEPSTMPKVKESLVMNSEHIDSFVRLFSEQKLHPSTTSIVKEEPVEPAELPISPPSVMDASQLILMQFPDVLPCTRPSSSSAKPELASLADLPDGFLGKLQIYKSGRCRLKLNDETYLDVDIGKSTSFLQNVMVTEMASNNVSQVGADQTNHNDMNKLICLGDIKHKLIVSLDVDHVLQDTRQWFSNKKFINIYIDIDIYISR